MRDLDALKTILASGPALRFAILFGSAALAFRAAQDAVPLFVPHREDLSRWRAAVAIEHADFEPTLRAGLAVSEAVDVAMHVCTDEGWGVPDSQRAAFEMLAARAVIPADLARVLASVAQVRNRIAHGDASMDHERIWTELPAGLDALDAFVAAIASWCAPKPE